MSRQPGRDVANLGQVFTPAELVKRALGLRRNQGRCLEPSCGDGAFFARIPGCVGIELDPRVCPPGARNMDFFALPDTETFDTIVGNPPYVRCQDIRPDTRRLLDASFDKRANLYLFFIEKCLRHLTPGGEMILITPREFMKATSARKLNERLYAEGTITDVVDLGDKRVFSGYAPNCIIWRFEKGNFSHRTNGSLNMLLAAGQLLFLKGSYPIPFSSVFSVRVGGVTGADDVFTSPEHGNIDVVGSRTIDTGEARRMIYNIPHPALLPHKARLLARGVRKFDETNWWEWGRNLAGSDAPRIYVNLKTRRPRPFFLHPAKFFDGSILALFPRKATADLRQLCDFLNGVDWNELGFCYEGRFLFGQRALEASVLPAQFSPFVMNFEQPDLAA